MRFRLLFMMLFVGIASFAQQQGSLPSDSIQLEKSENFEIYLGAAYHLNQFAGTGGSFGAIYAGMVIKRRLDVNVYYAGILDDFHLMIIFPQEHSYDQHNYGISANYMFLKGNIRPMAGVGYQYSVARWNPESDSHDTFTDNIHIFSAVVGVGWQIVPAFRIEAKTGYNYAQDVEIIGLQNSDFDGYKLEITAKLKILGI